MKGGSWINHILNTTVVCLAYPLYKNREKIKDNVSIIFASVLVSHAEFHVSVLNTSEHLAILKT